MEFQHETPQKKRTRRNKPSINRKMNVDTEESSQMDISDDEEDNKMMIDGGKTTKKNKPDKKNKPRKKGKTRKHKK